MKCAEKSSRCNDCDLFREFIHWAALQCLGEYTTLLLQIQTLLLQIQAVKKVKVAHARLPSVEFRSWSRFLAVSLQVTWVINPAVGCHYFPSGLQLPSQPLWGLLPVFLLGEQRHNGCEQFA